MSIIWGKKYSGTFLFIKQGTKKTNSIIATNKGCKMEKSATVNQRKRRASVFDPFEEEVRQYIAIGISYSAIHKLISEKMFPKWGYHGFYRWIMRTIVVS